MNTFAQVLHEHRPRLYALAERNTQRLTRDDFWFSESVWDDYYLEEAMDEFDYEDARNYDFSSMFISEDDEDDYPAFAQVYAAPTWLKVLFLTGVNVSTSYYVISVDEVKAGLWQLTYTNDFEHFYKIEGGKAQEDTDLETAIKNIFKGGDSSGDSD